jgi:short-subunit dehydrogenase
VKRIVIFGATSAIATACARLWAERGDSLFLVGRDAGKLQRLADDLRVRATGGQVVSVTSDLDELSDHPRLLVLADQALGGFDEVLIAHGTLSDQKACEASIDLAIKEIHTNALSAISLASLVGNRLEAQRAGVLAVIGSVAGDRGRQSNYVYGSAKGMLALFLSGLRNRLARHGVAVVTIKPGFVDTPMTAHLAKSGLLWAQPEAIAAGILRAMDARQDVVYLPWFWRWIMLVIRSIPERLFKRLTL